MLSGRRQEHHKVVEGERASGERQLFQTQLSILLEVSNTDQISQSSEERSQHLHSVLRDYSNTLSIFRVILVLFRYRNSPGWDSIKSIVWPIERGVTGQEH